MITMIAMLALPAGAGILATADLLVPIALGSKWLDTIPLIRLLAFFGMTNAMQSNIGAAYLALGKPKILSALSLIYVAVFIPRLVVLTRPYGALGAAWECLGAAMVVLPVNYAIMFRTLTLSLRDFAAVIWRPLAGAAGMPAAVRAFLRSFPSSPDLLSQAAHLGRAVGIRFVSYVSLVLMLWVTSGRTAGAETVILREGSLRFHRVVRRFRGGPSE